MTKQEYKRAIRQAQRVFCCVRISDARPANARISKVRALELIALVPDDATIAADWLDDDHHLLMIG